MIIKWHRVGPGQAHLYTAKDKELDHEYRPDANMQRGVYVNGDMDVAYTLELHGNSWHLTEYDSVTVFDCATDDLDAAIAKINLLFDTR